MTATTDTLSCTECGRPMRPRGTPPDGHTVRAHSKTTCDMCYQATRRQRPPTPISLDIETLALERIITAVTPPPRGILDNAACADTDPDSFFEEPGSGIGRAAKRICATCPVKAECLEWALDNHEVYGVWGGTSEKQRRAIRAKRKAAE